MEAFVREGFPQPGLGHLIQAISATARGTWGRARREQIAEVADTFPFWQWLTVGDQYVRMAHRVLDNRIFRADDPFWREFYPPTDAWCRCTVTAVMLAEVKRKGLEQQVYTMVGIGDRGDPILVVTPMKKKEERA
jgi:SPP1 gp7 family putative phage head morphogenesis protein